MKKASVSFRVIGDSGPLTISWFDGPKGAAVEANNEIGVGFFSDDGHLLCVEFDDVNEKHDSQVLKFDRYQVEVTVDNGKVSFALTTLRVPRKKPRSSKAKSKSAA